MKPDNDELEGEESFEDYLAHQAGVSLEKQADEAAIKASNGEVVVDHTDEGTPDIPPALIAEVKVTELQIKQHPVSGTYLVEVPVTKPIDDEWKKVFIESYNLTTEMNADSILERIHRNETAIIAIKNQNFGLRKGLEDKLRNLNEKQRAELLEKDRKFRVKKETEGPTSRGPNTRKSTAGKSDSMKTADVLFGLAMSRDAIVEKLKGLKRWDDRVSEYLDKLFSK